MRFGGKIAILLACFAVTSCASLMVDKNTHDYPQASKDLFVSSCVSSGGNQQACTCMLGKVQEKYTYGEMEDLEAKIKAGEPPAEFKDFMDKTAKSCANPGVPAAPSKSVQPQ